ncbi:MAG: Esterase/lipase [uncultured Sphingomonas sp.]|uniref:Esterase/lipase n=1 Tax=uncultured Sphingomonas sp. TaxID=158754 RepID=A0A6J4TS88_9SPHN|nr:alpha/beta hydrolase [uncultured Sphingomonas sp.]CAA9529675.1 MAG: Esterase/lipase [uncultured Sphingomonas sp.]
MTQPSIRPDVRALLDQMEAAGGKRAVDVPLEEARGMLHASKHLFDAPTGELAVIRDVAGGPCPMRLYDTSHYREEPRPVMVFYHGGGFVLGDIDTHEPLCAEIARLLDLPVVSVGYGLAPEHPFPAGVEDAIAAARWIAENPHLGGDATGLILTGDSAGGNLAIVTATALRDEPAVIPVLAQWLMYPAANPTKHHASLDRFGEGYLLSRESMDWFHECYAPNLGDWRYDPMLVDQKGLPPTLVVTAGLDPIRDQGRAYAAACAEAGVSVVYLECAGTIHGFMNLRKALPSAQADLERSAKYLRVMLENAR